jgi:hypothetical protein
MSRKPPQYFIEFAAKIDRQFLQLRSDMHIMMVTALENAKIYHDEKMSREMGALREGFRDEVQVALDQTQALTEKAENHESRLCKLENSVI